jgi:hypothetical protein
MQSLDSYFTAFEHLEFFLHAGFFQNPYTSFPL